MHIRRFLGKIAGSYLAIGALSVSAFAVADVNPGHDHVGNWGNAPVHGDSWVGAPSCGPSSCAPKCCPDECCNPPPSCGVAYNPEAYFTCDNCTSPCGAGFMDSLRFRADFLWWRPSLDCLTLGTEQFISTFPDGGVLMRSKTKAPDFKFDPGFRIGLASVCPCDCWDIAANWTHFHSKATANGHTDLGRAPVSNSDVDTFFISEWQRVGNAIPDFSKGKWSLDMDLVDLEFGRKYYVSNCFILRPYFGLRGARIDQSFRVHAEANRANEDEGDGFGFAFFTSDAKAKNNFLGVGPRVGIDLELALPCFCNFKLFGQAAGSLLYGRFERHARDAFHDFSTGTYQDNLPRNLAYEARATKHRTSRAVTDLAIGLKWEHCCNWCNRSHPITLAVAWEHHGFFDFNEFIFERVFAFGEDIVGDDELGSFLTLGRQCGGNLTTQGLTVSAEIGF